MLQVTETLAIRRLKPFSPFRVQKHFDGTGQLGEDFIIMYFEFYNFNTVYISRSEEANKGVIWMEIGLKWFSLLF